MAPDVLSWAERHQMLAIAGAVVALVLVALVVLLAVRLSRAGVRLAQKVREAGRTEDVLTYLAAGIATGVSATGMWRFAGDVLGFEGPLRVLLFGFIEIGVITSAVRARKAWRASAARIEQAGAGSWQQPSAGIDGKAVWVLTAFTAVCSAMDSEKAAEVVFRLAAPLVAAWLWERGMALELDEIMTRRPSQIAWKVTPERLLVRLGLADPTNRDASDIAVDRYLTRAALAAKRVRTLDAKASDRTRRRAQRRYEKAMDAAVEYAGVATSEERLAALGDRLRVLFNQADLPFVSFPAPWRAWESEMSATVRAERADPELDPGPGPNGGRPVESAEAHQLNPVVPVPMVVPAPRPVPAAPVASAEVSVVPASGVHVPADVPPGDNEVSPAVPIVSTPGTNVPHDVPAGGVHVPVPVPLVRELKSKASQVRAAIAAVMATGTELDQVSPATLVAYLESQGVALPMSHVKTELKRERDRRQREREGNARVIPLDGVHRRTPEGTT